VSSVVATLNGTRVDLPYAAITDLEETPGWLWSTLRLRTAEGDIFLSGAPKAGARDLIQKITPRISAAVTNEVTKLQEPARRLFRHLDSFLTSPKYLAQSDLQNWLNAVQALPQPELVRLRTLLTPTSIQPPSPLTWNRPTGGYGTFWSARVRGWSSAMPTSSNASC